MDLTEISIIWDYSIAVHYFNSRRSNKSNETQLRNRSLSFKLESPKYGVDHIIKRKSVFMKEVHVTKLPKNSIIKPKIQL